MTISVYDLTYGYLKKYHEGEVTDKVVTKTMKSFIEILDRGVTDKMMIEKMKTKRTTLDEFVKMFSKSKPSSLEKNFLKSDKFYWHPQLRCMPGPPQRVIDYDTGTIKKIEEQHFLEMRASYTLEDLYFYYIRQHGEPETLNEVNKYKGGLRYLLSQYSLDTILFMIDASANHIRSEDYQPLKSPLDIADYSLEAQRALGEKITEERMAGDDVITPKQRVPIHRGRSKASKREI